MKSKWKLLRKQNYNEEKRKYFFSSKERKKAENVLGDSLTSALWNAHTRKNLGKETLKRLVDQHMHELIQNAILAEHYREEAEKEAKRERRRAEKAEREAGRKITMDL